MLSVLDWVRSEWHWRTLLHVDAGLSGEIWVWGVPGLVRDRRASFHWPSDSHEWGARDLWGGQLRAWGHSHQAVRGLARVQPDEAHPGYPRGWRWSSKHISLESQFPLLKRSQLWQGLLHRPGDDPADLPLWRCEEAGAPFYAYEDGSSQHRHGKVLSTEVGWQDFWYRPLGGRNQKL